VIKLIIISGPTASGKTAVAVKLSKLFPAEIISADSRQVYKFMDIGTNKAGKYDEISKTRIFDGIPQHLTDIIDPSETFSAGEFLKMALETAADITARKKMPLVVGGTGLYIKALTHGLAKLPERNEELRKKFSGLNFFELYEALKKIDPDSAEKNKKNPQRLLRALEVTTLTGSPISKLHNDTVKPDIEYMHFYLNWPREELYENIKLRSSAMISNGIFDETKRLLKLGFGEDSPGLKSIGYRNVLSLLRKEISSEEALSLLTRDTRRYAKRQETWFRKYETTTINIDNITFDPENIASKIHTKLHGFLSRS